LETNGGLKPNGVTELEKQLKEVRAKHFGARTRKTKEKYRTEDKKIRSQIAELLKQGGINETSADLITDWNPYDQNASAKWFDAEWMFGVEKGFDIVIGNPPYIFVTEFSDKEKTYFSKHFQTYSYRFDIYGLFIELSFERMLRKNGCLSLIIPHTLLNNDSFEILRKFLLEKSTLNSIVDLGGGVFESAKNETMIFFAQNIKPTQKSKCYVVKAKNNLDGISNGTKVLQSYFSKIPKSAFLLSMDSQTIDLSGKLRLIKSKLGEVCTINQGLRTGILNKASVLVND
ncbi:MAG: Eco57I restriction-modification methylase domain-containing protein, partial [Acidobacteria bacterium]|nr:Eco57I restriction-modification methylase domain-containing protein [Acidobacteriota bacterium]